MSDFSLSVREQGNVVVIETTGYLNNVGGEKVSEACYEKMDVGKKHFLLNLENSKVVNSIGVSILIEIIEKLQDVDIMGLTKYSTVYYSEAEGLDGMA